MKFLTRFLAAGCVCLALSAIAYGGARRGESQEIRDLHYGEVLFHFYQQQYFSAITTLQTSQQFQRVSHHRDEAELLLGGMYLSYGLHSEADAIFRRLIDAGAPAEIRDRAWFYLAKIQYQRGYLAEAEETLKRIHAALPGELEEERKLLQARLLMARQEYRQAAQVLERMQGKSIWTQYGRYNLGVALISAGDVAEGNALLESVGHKSADGEELRSLKDKANVALGYAALRDGQAARAQGYLEQVRLDGLLSDKALLGMGWALSAQNRHEESLVPWAELQKRNVVDASVQESWLAVPFGLGHVGAYQQSLEHYEGAITIFTNEMTRIDASIAAIRSGKMVEQILQHDTTNEMGWFWRMREIPDAPESRYLLHLMSTHAFQEALKNYRDLRFLMRNLDYWTSNIGVYHDMLDTRRQAYARKLPQVLQEERSRNLGKFSAARNRDAAELVRIEKEDDVMALANEKEMQLLGRLDAVEDGLKRLAGQQGVTEARDKQRLLRGLLSWDVAYDFKPRLWQAKVALSELDQHLAATLAQQEELRRAQADAPTSFENFAARTAQLRDRIARLQAEARNASAEQGRYLENLAVAELSEQKERLAAYLTQARFAVAQMYDEANNAARGKK